MRTSFDWDIRPIFFPSRIDREGTPRQIWPFTQSKSVGAPGGVVEDNRNPTAFCPCGLERLFGSATMAAAIATPWFVLLRPPAMGVLGSGKLSPAAGTKEPVRQIHVAICVAATIPARSLRIMIYIYSRGVKVKCGFIRCWSVVDRGCDTVILQGPPCPLAYVSRWRLRQPWRMAQRRLRDARNNCHCCCTCQYRGQADSSPSPDLRLIRSWRSPAPVSEKRREIVFDIVMSTGFKRIYPS